MYLGGNFGVYANKVWQGEMAGVFHAEKFYVGATPKTIRNTITDGLPFFSGCLTLRKNFTCNGEKVKLTCVGRYHYVEVYVNDTYAGALLFDDTLDISAFTHTGENTVDFHIYTADRNMLGPHHLKTIGAEFAVSPYSFDLFGTWQDGESKEFSEKYTFIRFGFFKEL